MKRCEELSAIIACAIATVVVNERFPNLCEDQRKSLLGLIALSVQEGIFAYVEKTSGAWDAFLVPSLN